MQNICSGQQKGGLPWLLCLNSIGVPFLSPTLSSSFMQVHIQQSDSGAQQTPPHAPFQTESGPLCAENLTQPWSDTSVRFWTEPAAVDLQNWRVDLMDSPPLSLALYLRTSGNSVGFASHMLILTSHLVKRLIQSTVLLLLCWSDSRPYF